jgi:hypothetical protein
MSGLQSNSLKMALAYAKRGWSVIPAHHVTADGECSCGRSNCGNPGKHPRIGWVPYQTSAADETTITQWWSRWEQANVAIVTGAVSGLVVLDIDVAHGGDDSLHVLQMAHGKLPETPMVLTGGGGQHYYFAHPGDRSISGGSGFSAGVDLRADGGIVIAPPSVHASGRSYEWEVSSDIADTPLAPMPPLVEWLVEQRPHVLGEDVNAKSATFDIETALESPVPEGERNHSMTQIAGWFAGRGDPEAVVYATLSATNQRICTPPLDDEEIRSITRSICRREARRAQAQVALEERAADLQDDSDVAPDDRLEMARVLWRELGVEAIADWVVLQSADDIEYYLETPSDEISLGVSLISQRPLQARLLDYGRILMTPVATKDWPSKALLLRRLAREVIIDSTRVSDRITEWLDAYLEGRPPAEEVPSDARKDYLRSSPILVNGRLHLRPNKVAEFCQAALGERATTSQIRKLLRQAGWEPVILKSGDSTTRAWRGPA